MIKRNEKKIELKFTNIFITGKYGKMIKKTLTDTKYIALG